MTILLKLVLSALRFPISGGKTNGDDARRWTDGDVIIIRVGVNIYRYLYYNIILLSCALRCPTTVFGLGTGA